jgi:TolB protein
MGWCRRFAGVVAVVLALIAAGGSPDSRIVRVSVDSAGGQAEDFDAVPPDFARGSWRALVSGSGRYVAFASNAADLVPGPDADGAGDAFVHDLRSGRTEPVAIPGEPADALTEPADISRDGRFVLVISNLHLYLRDRKRDRTARLGPSDATIFEAALSADGRRVAYQAAAPFGPGRAYLTDLRAGTTELVGIGPSGEPVETYGGLALSGDGYTVAFGVNATPNSTVFVRDLRTGVTRLISSDDAGGPAFTYDGREVAYSTGGGIPFSHIEVADTATGQVVASVPRAGDAALSADGRYLSFFDAADGLTPFPGEVELAQSVYRLDRRTGTILRVSVNQAGGQPNNGSFFADISDDGRIVAFSSAASDLVPGDTNEVEDVFARHISGH